MKAPRLPSCFWHPVTRGAMLMLCALLPLQGAPLQAQQTATAHDPKTITIVGASFEAPTTRYDHAVLGPNAEWGTLRITFDLCPDCAALKLSDTVVELPRERVFEDLEPRLIDLDADGVAEVVVIESHAAKGARLSVYGPLGLITATPYIGTRYRWLAPLGAADLDGDGYVELAYIDRPHLAKTLRVWRYKDGALTQVAAAGGLTNHRIGEDWISGGIRDCGAGPEIITADARWRRVIATTLASGELVGADLGAFAGQESFAKALACEEL